MNITKIQNDVLLCMWFVNDSWLYHPAEFDSTIRLFWKHYLLCSSRYGWFTRRTQSILRIAKKVFLRFIRCYIFLTTPLMLFNKLEQLILVSISIHQHRNYEIEVIVYPPANKVQKWAKSLSLKLVWKVSTVLTNTLTLLLFYKL